MGYSGHSIPTMIVGVILTAILIFVGVRINPENYRTEMKQTTTQETTKQATTKQEKAMQDFNPVKDARRLIKVLMIFVPVFAGCNLWILIKLYKLYAY